MKPFDAQTVFLADSCLLSELKPYMRAAWAFLCVVDDGESTYKTIILERRPLDRGHPDATPVRESRT